MQETLFKDILILDHKCTIKGVCTENEIKYLIICNEVLAKYNVIYKLPDRYISHRCIVFNFVLIKLGGVTIFVKINNKHLFKFQITDCFEIAEQQFTDQ